MKALIDSDLFRYQYGSVTLPHPFAGEGDVPDDAMVPAPAAYVCHLVDEAIKEILYDLQTDEYLCVLSGKGNFRNEIAVQQPYKGNRDPNTARPYHYDTIGEHLIKNHPVVIVDGYEADDYLGIMQRADLENCCIASRDKDLKTVHGWHYRFSCGKAQPAIQMHWVDELEAAHFFFYQMLIGDNTDNIPGCGVRQWVKWGTAHVVTYGCGTKVKIPKMVLRRKGVGSETALKILEDLDVQGMYNAVSKEYENVFGDNYKEIMLEMARLLYIGQEPDNLFEWSWLGITDFDANNKSIDNNN